MTREDKEAIIRRLEAMYGEAEDNETKEALFYAIETLKEQRPHGEWEFIGENLFKCTHCGYIADADYLRKWKVHTYDAEFPTSCLKCGADMRKEGENNDGADA